MDKILEQNASFTKTKPGHLGATRTKPGFQKFILLRGARTGSNFLRSLLDSHKNVSLLGEMFNVHSLPKSYIRRLLTDPIKYYQEITRPDGLSDIQAVGFKLQYQLPIRGFIGQRLRNRMCGELKRRRQNINSFLRENFDLKEANQKQAAFWDYLRVQRDLKIIHLKRRNTLKRFLSFRRAHLTDEWVKVGNACRSKLIKIHLSYEDCVIFFRRARFMEEKHDIFFKDSDKLEIFYEDLLQNPRQTLKAVQKMIGVKYRASLKSIFKKQNRSSLSKSIANYWELKDKFKGSPWAKFFEE